MVLVLCRFLQFTGDFPALLFYSVVIATASIRTSGFCLLTQWPPFGCSHACISGADSARILNTPLTSFQPCVLMLEVTELEKPTLSARFCLDSKFGTDRSDDSMDRTANVAGWMFGSDDMIARESDSGSDSGIDDSPESEGVDRSRDICWELGS